MTINDAIIRDLLGFEDAQGVLSFYTGFTPSQAADRQPTAPIELRNQLKALRAEVAARDAGLAKAVERRLEDASPALDRLLDPKRGGRGRVLFLGVASGRTETLSVALPFRERVVLHDSPFLRPLVAAYDEGRPAGVAVVSRSGVRLLRWQVGEVSELTSRGFEVPDQVLADEKAGPSVGNPEHPHHGFVDRDRFEDRVDMHRHRFLAGFAAEVLAAAKEEGWDRVVVSAMPKLRDPVAEVLVDTPGITVVHADTSWEDAAPHEVAEQVWPLLRSGHVAREEQLATTAVDRAYAGGPAALGLRQVCAALNEGRVAHLLFDDARTIAGFQASDGSLHARVEGAVAASDLTFDRVGLFLERLVERAIRTGAKVTPLEPAAAARLTDHEGIAALLRW